MGIGERSGAWWWWSLPFTQLAKGCAAEREEENQASGQVLSVQLAARRGRRFAAAADFPPPLCSVAAAAAAADGRQT
jgi:hypothetical protein